MVQLIKVGSKQLLAALPWERPDSAYQDLTRDGAGRAGLIGGLLSKASGKKPKVSPAAQEAAVAKVRRSSVVAGRLDMPVRAFLTKQETRNLPAPSKVFALAEVFSSLPNLQKAAILVAPIDGVNNAYVMCASINGAPAPDPRYDVVVSSSEVPRLLGIWHEDLTQGMQRAPIIYGTWPERNAIVIDHELTLEQLVERAHGYHSLRRLGSSQRNLAVIGLCIAALLAGDYGYTFYKKNMAAKAARARQLKENPIRQYTASLEQQWSQKSWGSAERVGAIINAIGEIPPKLAGFDLDKDISCVVESMTCSLKYKRAQGSTATYQQFNEAATGRFNPSPNDYGHDGSSVAINLTVQDPGAATAPTSWKDLPDIQTINYAFWTEAHEHSMVKSTLDINSKLFPNAPGVSEAALPIAVRSTKVTLSFEYLPMIAETMPPSSPIFKNAISWNTVGVQRDGVTAKITLTGDLYVKKANH